MKSTYRGPLVGKVPGLLWWTQPTGPLRVVAFRPNWGNNPCFNPGLKREP